MSKNELEQIRGIQGRKAIDTTMPLADGRNPKLRGAQGLICIAVSMTASSESHGDLVELQAHDESQPRELVGIDCDVEERAA